MNISFREIRKDDYNFLYLLNKILFKDYVTQIWGWDENWQKARFKNNFDLQNGEIIVCNKNNDVGFLWVEENPNDTFLRSILVLPEYQKKGIGSKIIVNLQKTSQNPVVLRVFKLNPARNLYERLGFRVVEETKTHFIMKSQEEA